MTSMISSTVPPRLLYLPNEEDASERCRQTGGRNSFGAMERDGVIRELGIYSFLADYHIDGNKNRSHRRLLDEVTAFRPDILFWQHPEGFPLDAEFLAEVRRRAGNPVIAYHEADPFDVFYKRAKESSKALYCESDVFLTVALGEQRRLFQKFRLHPQFYYSPHPFTPERVGDAPDPAVVGSRYDAVMIGSIAYRMKILKHPGSAERIALARGLTRLLGDRFASFGNRWPAGTNCHGFLDSLEQTQTIHSSRMSVIWENFPDHTFYFSDRLPISIASGIPHITSRRPGYDVMFGKAPGLFFADTVEDAVDIACYLRSLPIKDIVELGSSARAWAVDHFGASAIFRNAFDNCAEVWRRRSMNEDSRTYV